MCLLLAGSAAALDLRSLQGDQSSRIRFLSLSPDEQVLAVESLDASGKTDIHLVYLGGESAPGESAAPLQMRRLTSFGEAAKPVFSPDGQHIAFTMRNGLFVMERNGANKRLVAEFTPGRANAANLAPSWFGPQHLLLFGIPWERYTADNPAVSSHIAVQDLSGERRWVMGLTAETRITLAAAHPTKPRLALVEDGRLTSFDLDLTEMMLLALADPDGFLTYSPDGSLIAYRHRGELNLVRSDGSAHWSLGPGFSPTWSGTSNLCLFLREERGGTHLHAWQRQSGKVWPLEGLLERQRQARASLRELDQRVLNLTACLSATVQEIAGESAQFAAVAKVVERIETDEHFERSRMEIAHRDYKVRYTKLDESHRWQEESAGVLLARLQAISIALSQLSESLPLDTDPVPFIGYLASMIEEIDDAGGRVESSLVAVHEQIPALTAAADALWLQFQDARDALVAADSEAKAAQRERLEKIRQENLRLAQNAATVVGVSLVLLMLLRIFYVRFLLPKMQLRRLKKRFDLELKDDLDRVKVTLTKATDQLRQEKLQKVAWQEILANTSLTLNEIFRDTHQVELERIKRLGDFYKKVSDEIAGMEMTEEQKVQLLDAFRTLMRQGMDEASEETPFQERLRDMYAQLTKT